MEYVLESGDLINSFPILFFCDELLNLLWNHENLLLPSKIIYISVYELKKTGLSLPHTNLSHLLGSMQRSMLETMCVYVGGITEIKWIYFVELFNILLNKSAFY